MEIIGMLLALFIHRLKPVKHLRILKTLNCDPKIEPNWTRNLGITGYSGDVIGICCKLLL